MTDPMQYSRELFIYDFGKTLFPMETCRFLIEHGEEEIRLHIRRCLSGSKEDKHVQFLAQSRVYASKPQNHLRRTVKLDPVAEFYLYDIIFSTKSRFRKPYSEDKKHFGYRFENGEIIHPSASYAGFKGALTSYREKYTYSFSFDVASYFNNIYHHDIITWFANLGVDARQVENLGQFLRLTNSGRSIDCLPQGIFPAKMIGNDFLRFVEQHHSIKSPAVVRFMDDIVLFSDVEANLWEDFYLIQKLLGEKGLSVNPSKSKFSTKEDASFEDVVDDVKAKLLQKRRVILFDYEGDGTEIQISTKLDEKEMGYVRELLKTPNLAEEDAELVLSIFRDFPEEVAPHLEEMTRRFPHLVKNIWSFCRLLIEQGDEFEFGTNYIADFLQRILKLDSLQEYQLFWFGYMLQDYLMDTTQAPAIIEALYNHKNASQISKAKILEIADNRYGLLELRDANLVAGRSDWLAWASAIGHRTLPTISRNHKLSYFANSSQMNHLIKSILMKV